MCVGFLPLLRIRSLNELAKQTNSSNRIYAGNNINHVVRCPCQQRIAIKACQQARGRRYIWTRV